MTTTADDTATPTPLDPADPADPAAAPAPTALEEAEARIAQLDGELRTATTKLSDTRHLLGRTQLDLDSTAGQLREAQRSGRELGEEFDTFKATVRDTAISLTARHGWCDVVDEALRDMGLQGRERDYRVSVNGTWSTTVQVTATSRDNAESQVRQMNLGQLAREISAGGSGLSDVIDYDFDTTDIDEAE